MLRSIRVRLMLWYVAILTLILLLFAAALYFTTRRTLLDQLDDTLQNRAFLTQELIAVEGSGPPRLDLGTNAPNPDTDDTFHRLLDPAGAVLYDDSQAFPGLPVQDSALARAREGGTDLSTIGEARVLSVPVLRDGDVVGVLQVGRSTDDVNETLRSMLLIFAVALPSALALASLGGWWLSSRALSPIDGLTRAARDITGGRDLSRRLDLDLPDDELGRLARTFDEMIARLDAAFRRQRQFTSDASHELRTPLTAVRGQIEVALERPRDPAEYRRVLAAVNDQVARMTRLVSGLLMLARSDAGSLPLQRERLDLGDLVESVAGQVRPLAERKGLEVRVQGDGALVANGDEDLLLQLMLNLADNAIKYTDEGAITLGWRAAPAATMFVRDTGPGIAPEHRDRIFERFYRADPARSADEGGAGLGLAISQWIAQAHGGTLSVDSDDTGSTFTVILPPSPS